LLDEPAAPLGSEVSTRNAKPSLIVVVGLQSGSAFDSDAPKRGLCLEDGERAPRVSFHVEELDVTFSEYDLNVRPMKSEPHRRHRGRPVPAIGGQHGWGRQFEQTYRISRPVFVHDLILADPSDTGTERVSCRVREIEGSRSARTRTRPSALHRRRSRSLPAANIGCAAWAEVLRHWVPGRRDFARRYRAGRASCNRGSAGDVIRTCPPGPFTSRTIS
jgi:hypothetical protein